MKMNESESERKPVKVVEDEWETQIYERDWMNWEAFEDWRGGHCFASRVHPKGRASRRTTKGKGGGVKSGS